MSDARRNILERLQASQSDGILTPEYGTQDSKAEGGSADRFIAMIEAVRAKVVRTPSADWRHCLEKTLVEHKVRRLLVGAASEPGKSVAAQPPPKIEIVDYAASIESWKHELFHDIDAALTSSIGAIAETGSIMLWPSVAEPRLMSLVPPLHIVVLDAGKIYGTLAEALRAQRWATAMPTNALLISGPSKTADIEQVLAYGVHGPKQLLVILRE